MAPGPRHVPRPAPPWRDTVLVYTECGQTLTSTTPTAQRAQVVEMLAAIGIRRARMAVCTACAKAVQDAPGRTWERDPLAVLNGEVTDALERPDLPWLLRDEVRALAELAARHPQEYARLLDPDLYPDTDHRSTA